MYARIWWYVMMKNIWFLQLKPRVAFEHGMMELCIIWAIFFMFAYYLCIQTYWKTKWLKNFRQNKMVFPQASSDVVW